MKTNASASSATIGTIFRTPVLRAAPISSSTHAVAMRISSGKRAWKIEAISFAFLPCGGRCDRRRRRVRDRLRDRLDRLFDGFQDQVREPAEDQHAERDRDEAGHFAGAQVGR